MGKLTTNLVRLLLAATCVPGVGCLGASPHEALDPDGETERSALTLPRPSAPGIQPVAPSRPSRPSLPSGGQEVYDPDISPCAGTAVSPELATDGQRVYLDAAEASEGMRVVLTGYRYNDAPPTRTRPAGEGREAVYCGCRRVLMEGGSAEFPSRPYFVVPDDAPSGDYDLELLPASGDCAAGGIGATCEPAGGCDRPTLSVVPSYIVTTMERLDVDWNSEDDDDNPAEMSFIFAAGSGTAFGDGERLVAWGGSFPGEGHITNADGTTLDAHVPLFVGDESLMNVQECLEECVASRASAEAGCAAQCESDQALGRYSNRMDLGFGGLEVDDDWSAEAWGAVAGVAATVLSCWAAAELGHSCLSWEGGGGALGIGTAVGLGVQQLLQDDDDDLGTASATASHSADWNVGPTFGPVALSGPSGDIGLYYRTRRLPAPRILDYSVRLVSITVDDSYEEDDCAPPNEVYVHARGQLHQGESSLPGTVRLPDGDAVLSLDEGETYYFGSSEGVIDEMSFTPETAPESPFLYVELGVWEDDSSPDLMGIAAETLPLGDSLSASMDGTDDTTSEGYFVRHATFTRSVSVHGYAGSDNHCWGLLAHGWDPDAEEGGATLVYEVELTWLKAQTL